jgi:hypothetical protein
MADSQTVVQKRYVRIMPERQTLSGNSAQQLCHAFAGSLTPNTHNDAPCKVCLLLPQSMKAVMYCDMAGNKGMEWAFSLEKDARLGGRLGPYLRQLIFNLTDAA